jgi:hypothetical protein
MVFGLRCEIRNCRVFTMPQTLELAKRDRGPHDLPSRQTPACSSEGLRAPMNDKMPVVLPRDIWEHRAWLHAQRIRPWIAPYLDQKSRQAKHPVYDFLFQYYSFRPAQLVRWSPGPDATIEAARIEDLPGSQRWWEPGAGGWRLLPFPNARREYLEWAVGFLEATSVREPNFCCFGLHEWAMVYREGSIRHWDVPLRLESSEIAAAVESHNLVCTHFDAFRFFHRASEKA